jgi:hypothetical protein
MADDAKAPLVSLAVFSQSARNAGAALVLTLLVWVLFYEAQLPLDLPGTVVVALAALILVVLAQSLWSWLGRGKPKPNDTHP